MFTFWSNAWKNGEVFFEKMFTGIIVVCRYIFSQSFAFYKVEKRTSSYFAKIFKTI